MIGSSGPITRLSVGSREFGKLKTDDARWLGKLIELGIVEVRGTVVSAPAYLTLMCDVILQVQIYLTARACLPPPPTATEQEVKDRKAALLILFKTIGLRANGAEKLDDAVEAVEDEKDLEGDQVEMLYDKARSFEDVGLADPREGINVELREYQKQALAWMTAKENLTTDTTIHSIHPLWEEYSFPPDPENPTLIPDNTEKFYYNPYTGELSLEFPSAADKTRGGILADEMGLGKTLETLSLIHTNRPDHEWTGDLVCQVFQGSQSSTSHVLDADSSNGTAKKTQLPRSPSTLIVCPVSLIAQWRDEIENKFTDKCLTCVLHYGTDRNLSLSQLTNSKTAPDVVITSYGVVSREWSVAFPGGSASTNRNKTSMLFGVEWFRIVLDEAHFIRNRDTGMARSCSALEASRRWCVTGTPIQNKLEDLYSLVHFLRIDPWSNSSFWRQFITVPFLNKDMSCINVVQSILEPLVLRRQKSTPWGPEGKPLVSLPTKTVDITYLDFSVEERDIYTALWRRTKTQLNAFVQAGTVMSHWAHVFQMLTRLRQCCLHPSLAMGGASKSGVVGEDEQRLNDLIERFQAGGEGDEFMASVIKKLSSSQAGTADSSDDDNACPICFDLMTQPTLLPCLHVSCYECIVGYLQQKESKGESGECPTCRREVKMEELLDVVRAPQAPVRSTSKLSEGSQPISSSPTAMDAPLSPPAIPAIRLRRHGPPPSTKLKTLIADLTQLRDHHPTIKSVIFSQFTSMLNICEPLLRDHGFQFVRLDGSLSQKQREDVLRTFAREEVEGPGEATVLLASVRSAGVGLNLVRASFVVILEPWWNAPVEQQTIDRVHRLGQTRPVQVKRYIMLNSVEEKMLKIQDRKRVLTNVAMGQDKDAGQARVDELKALFE
ncbi:SNF2 family N-terminal domain-containing protein [Phlyctochytrium arcticum]|nr:SNF2 family N-terminal domain-containing protein [Phlyctochytrium arcticum]